jgi:RimJ/RimL family protein N-acetyltransferase
MLELHTARLDLVCATPAMLEADAGEGGSLADAASATVPEGWPPDLFDRDAVRWMLGWVTTHPDQARWGPYYIALRGDGRRTLVGTGGYKGPPDAEGRVEIGYSVLPSFQRRGIALEAVRGWVDMAFAEPRVRSVIAHTFPANVASIGVLLRAGFRLEEGASDPDDPGSIRYVLSREGDR